MWWPSLYAQHFPDALVANIATETPATQNILDRTPVFETVNKNTFLNHSCNINIIIDSTSHPLFTFLPTDLVGRSVYQAKHDP